MTRTQRWTARFRIAIVALALSLPVAGQTVTNVLSFTGFNNLADPGMTPVQGRDGKFYGTITGMYNATSGSVFDFTASGTTKVVYAFTGSTGNNPFGVILGTDGNWDGVTSGGGSFNYGVLFRVTPDGTYTALHNFTAGADGMEPTSPPIEGSDGSLYGTTNGGCCTASTVYKYTRSGSFSTIYTLDAAHGTNVGWLLEGSDGNLYAVAGFGGKYGNGTIVQLTTSGKLLSYYSFPGGAAGGALPLAMVQASDGHYYGTTFQGGVVQQGGIGTIFRYAPQSGASVIYTYDPQLVGGGGFPSSGLIQGTDGWLYGLTLDGGTNGYGTIFRISTEGTYQQLYSFTSTVGEKPSNNLLQATDGLFYGSAQNGGPYGYGTIFRLGMGLGSFVAFVQPTGKVGESAQILGQGLTGTTKVTFDGVPATSFSVKSDTFMTAVVPEGATTGKVVVTTPTGKLTSSVSFRILK